MNLLAVALNSRVWTLDTAWDAIFRYPAPRPFTLAFRKAMTRTPLSDPEIARIQEVARMLRIDLVVQE